MNYCIIFTVLVSFLGCAGNRSAADGPAADEPTAGPGAKTDESPNASVPEELGDATPPRTSGPTRPPPVLWLEPRDQTTNTGGTPIRAYIDYGGTPVADELLESVTAVLQLRSVGGSIVETTAKAFNPPLVTPSGGGAADTNARAYVELLPLAPLAADWHVLSLAKLPQGVTLAPWSAPNAPYGVYAARFHPASQPTLIRVKICEKAPGFNRAIVQFSENVKPAGTFESTFTIVHTASSNQCSYANSGPIASESVVWADFDCVDMDPASSWSINLAPGLASPSGQPLKAAGKTAGAFEVVPQLLPASYGDATCKEWRP